MTKVACEREWLFAFSLVALLFPEVHGVRNVESIVNVSEDIELHSNSSKQVRNVESIVNLSEDIELHSNSSKQVPLVKPVVLMERNAQRSYTTVNSSLNLTADATCVAATGGICESGPCADWRGPTQCTDDICLCKPGWCAGADGMCYEQKNKLIRKVRFRNARWSDLYLYVTNDTTDLYAFPEAFIGEGKGAVNLYGLPGQGGGYMITSVNPEKSPEHVVAFYWWNESQLVVKATQIVTNDTMPPAIDSLALRLVKPPPVSKAPEDEQLVMIESMREANQFLTIERESSEVQLSLFDPGVGGYWVLESDAADGPLNLDLPSYNGLLCKYDCGHYGSGSSLDQNNGATIMSKLLHSVLAIVAMMSCYHL